MIGYRADGFGFFKNFTPKLSAPDFEQIKIAVNQYVRSSIELIGK